MNAIEIRGLCKRRGSFCMERLDFAVPSGCILGLVGENGAGKTTLIRLILNMLKPDAGSVRVLGGDPARTAIRQDIGVVLDTAGIPDCLSAAQLGSILKHIYQNWDEQAYAHHLERLALPSQKSFKEFSRGMKMKLSIAAALSHHPKLLVLDEATSGLDPVVRDEVLEMLNEFTRGEDRSVLMSSHIVSDLEKACDYIAFLHHGRLLLCEEKDRLLEDYAILHCTAEALSALDAGAVLGKKCSPYGAQALVLREAVPAGWQLSPVSIEELFVFMIKEAA